MKRSTKIIGISLIAVCVLIIAAVATYFIGKNAYKNFDPAVITNANQTLLIYDQNGDLITGVYGKENRLPVSLANISNNVINALISTEDTRFYQHSGIDVKRIFGAFVADIKAGSYVQGASTITQQLVKLSHLTNEKTMDRKIKEALLAIQLEDDFSKNQILEMYLNYVYFGKGAYGIQAAAQTYFKKDCNDLTISQAALLVGILKAPSRYAPHLDKNASIERRNLIITNMLNEGYINAEQAQQAKQEQVKLLLSDNSYYPHGYYTEYAMMEAKRYLGVSQEELLSSGYRIYTSLNTSLQTHCEELFLDDTLFPKSTQNKMAQGAMVVIDPRDFSIKTLIGGREHEIKLGLDRATSQRRQPGSAIKPVMVFAPALEKFGYTAASLMLDEPTDFNGYKPRNFSEKYYGFVTMRTAVAKSLNVPAVRMLRDIGIPTASNYATSVGIPLENSDNTLAIALGGLTYGVTPLELCQSYVPFANSGLYAKPSAVQKITDAAGNILYQKNDYPIRVLSEQNAYILTSMLSSVITDGTGKRLDIGIPLAGKTGTVGYLQTTGNKDVWSVAYNSQYVATVWMGLDDTTGDNNLPQSVTGGTYPTSMLAKIFASLYPEGYIAPEFARPLGVKTVRLDSQTLQRNNQLKLANSFTPEKSVFTEIFTDNTAPLQNTDYWKVPSPIREITVKSGSAGKPIINFMPKEKYVMYSIYRLDGTSSVKLAEFPGDRGEIAFTDSTAQYNRRYGYYIIPSHPDTAAGDLTLQGPKSQNVFFTPTPPIGISLQLN